MKLAFAVFAVLLVVFASVQAETPADKSVCAQPKEVGPCRKAEPSFYYDADAKECHEFLYGGCRGNDNRFPSKEACEKTCL